LNGNLAFRKGCEFTDVQEAEEFLDDSITALQSNVKDRTEDLKGLEWPNWKKI
jgi:hypothetical protein